MRRGLISWSKDELPEAVLEARVAALQASMRDAGLDAVAVYTTPARTAGVSWLAGFVPYWNQGLLVVPRDSRPILVSALSNRVNDWLRRNAHVADVRNTPRIGLEAGQIVEALSGKGRIGVVDRPHLPAVVIDDLGAAGHAVTDATDLFAAIRSATDSAELELYARAARIAETALASVDPSEANAGRLVAAIDGEARRQGAEEVYPAVAVDLAGSRHLVRIEGPARLGATSAVRISVAYKGAWVRVTRTLSRDPEISARIAQGERRFAEAVATLPDTEALSHLAPWLIEGVRTTLPLEPLAGSMIDAPAALPAQGVVTVQATLDIDGTIVLAGLPILLSARSCRPIGAG